MTDDTEEAMDRRRSGGASIATQDPRVSNVQNWLFGLVGASIVGGILLIATSLYGLRDAVTRLVTQNESIMDKLGDYGDRIKELEKRRAP